VVTVRADGESSNGSGTLGEYERWRARFGFDSGEAWSVDGDATVGTCEE